MICPRCTTTLRVAQREGVEIDYCPQCQGVWLDRGELDKIIDRNQSYGYKDHRDDDDDHRGSPFGFGDHDKSHYRDGHGHHGRKKNFLSDLFDF